MALRLLVGYDGSDGAKAALDEAIDLAQQLPSELLVAYACGGPTVYAGAALTPRRILRELGEQALSEARDRASEGGVSVRLLLIEDSPVRSLLSAARRYHAAMIIVGTNGESRISGMFLGSTADKLVHSSTRPVLVVPAAHQDQLTSGHAEQLRDGRQLHLAHAQSSI